MKKAIDPKRFAICIADKEPDLVSRKVYQVLPDKSAARSDYLRVIDESGEDYYTQRTFLCPSEFPRRLSQGSLPGCECK